MERFVLIAVIVATLASLKECPTYTKALVSSNLEDNRNLLCLFKAYDSEEKHFGGLNAPSPFYLEYNVCETTRTCFCHRLVHLH